jgi:hypothetical protein
VRVICSICFEAKPWKKRILEKSQFLIAANTLRRKYLKEANQGLAKDTTEAFIYLRALADMAKALSETPLMQHQQCLKHH